MIKVNGPRQVDATATRRVARRGGGAGAFQVDQADPEHAVSHAGPTLSIGAVDSLLTLQGVEDSTEGRRRAVKRAGHMLDLLDDIRLSLLDGTIPSGKIQGLLKVVQTNRDDVADPQLTRILDEIELRARVELAKYAAQA